MERPSTPERAQRFTPARPVQVDPAKPVTVKAALPLTTSKSPPAAISSSMDHWSKAKPLGQVCAPRYTEVLRELASGPLCINDLTERLQLEQSYVSRTMQVLRDLGLVEFETQGAKHLYRLTRHSAIAHVGDRIILAIGASPAPHDCIAILSVADTATTARPASNIQSTSIHDILALAKLALASPASPPAHDVVMADADQNQDELITLRPLEPHSPAPDGRPRTRRGPTAPGSM